MSRNNWQITNKIQDKDVTRIKTSIGGFPLLLKKETGSWLLSSPPFYLSYRLESESLVSAQKEALSLLRTKFEDCILDVVDMKGAL